MGGRLLDYIAQGPAAERPVAADMPARIAVGASSVYYANDTKVYSFFNAATVAWDELDVGGLFANLADVDWTTPPADGQIFEWDAASNKLIPVDKPSGLTVEQVQDIIGSVVVNGAGITVTYNDAAGTVEVASNVTQYTDENAMDAIAALILNGAHTGISVAYDDTTNRFSLTNTVTQYTDEQAQDAVASAFAAGTHTGITITYDDATGKFNFTAAGSVARAAPTLIQKATLRGDGNLVLPAAPTVGNTLILVTNGFGGSISGYVPAGFLLCASYSSNANNTCQFWTREVQAGDAASYALTATDWHQAVLYEFSGVSNVVPYAGGLQTFSGANFTLKIPKQLYSADDVVLVSMTHDGNPQYNVTAETGLIVDYTAPVDGANHAGAIVRATKTHDGILAGTLSSGNPIWPCYGVVVVVGKYP